MTAALVPADRPVVADLAGRGAGRGAGRSDSGPARAVAVVLVCVVAMLCVSGPATAQQAAPTGEVSWSVEPARRDGAADRANFVFRAARGERIEDAIVVKNLGTLTLVLGVYASDAFNTAEGGVDLLAGAEEPVGAGSWVTVSSSAITVAPGESIEVPFTVSVPSDATAGDHSGGVVTSLTMSADDPTGAGSSTGSPDGTAVAIERRLGTRMHIRVDGETKPELSFKSMTSTYRRTLNPFAPGEMVLTYTVENTGNVRLRARRTATVKSSVGPARTSEAADMAELLPGNSYELTQTVTGVWPVGSVASQVELEPYEPTGAALDRAPTAAIARTSVSLVPWAQLVLLAVVVLIVLLFVHRRTTRTRPASRRLSRPS